MSKEREVLYVTATRIRFMCPMNFNKFPMDTQTCKFQVCANTILWNILIQTNPFQSEQILVTQINYFLKYILLQVGSFNYDNTKMVYRTYYLPLMPNSTESILDYEVQICILSPTGALGMQMYVCLSCLSRALFRATIPETGAYLEHAHERVCQSCSILRLVWIICHNIF